MKNTFGKNIRRSAADFFLLAGAFALAFVYSLRRMSDSDLWGHLKCGEYFFQHGSILKTYFFNSSWPDFPYLNHEWLFQVIIYLVQKFSGETGLVALQILLVLLSFFILYKILRLYTDSFTIISLVLSLGVIASSHRFALRPQHFTYVFFLYFLFSLHMHQQGVLKYARFMPLVMILWVNMHAESLWGVLAPAVFLGVEYIKSPGKDKKALKSLSMVFGLILLASLVNPFTYKTVVWPLFVMKEQFAGVEEILAPLSVKYIFFWTYFMLFAVSSAVNFRRVDPTWVALSLIFAMVAWTANRGIPHFVFVSAPVITANLDEIRKRYFLKPSRAPFAAAGIRLALLAGILYILVFVVTDPRYFRKYDDIPYPEGAVRFLKENGVKGNVFNEHLWGGYLLWEGYPELKPYIDGRFFQKKFYDEYFPALQGLPGWDNVLSKYRITIALLRYGETDAWRLNDALFSNPHWRLVYWDDASLVYLMTSEENRKVIKGFGNSLINPDRQGFLYEYQDRPPEFNKRANRAMEQNLVFARRSYKALIMSANTFFSLGDYRAALTRYEEALKYLEPVNAWIHYKLALCYRGIGDLGKAEEYLKKCLALAPDFEEGKMLLREVTFLLRKGT